VKEGIMTKLLHTSLLLAALALIACGDNKHLPDAAVRPDSIKIDAMCSDCPPAPMLGTTLIDRMGRPAINTALNHAFDTSTSAANTARDAYNADTNEATWVATYADEIKKNLGIFDALDAGICGNQLCETNETTGNCPVDCPVISGSGLGCGNQLIYQTPTSATSYGQLANLLANDVLYLDTSKAVCTVYLAVELGIELGQPHATCGGRVPQYDVIDFTYSALTMGIAGFSFGSLVVPRFNCDSMGAHCGDDVGPHTDYLSAFPYLGVPH
jgi:hypothetical protein